LWTSCGSCQCESVTRPTVGPPGRSESSPAAARCAARIPVPTPCRVQVSVDSDGPPERSTSHPSLATSEDWSCCADSELERRHNVKPASGRKVATRLGQESGCWLLAVASHVYHDAVLSGPAESSAGECPRPAALRVTRPRRPDEDSEVCRPPSLIRLGWPDVPDQPHSPDWARPS
jgi:hypothetical protein